MKKLLLPVCLMFAQISIAQQATDTLKVQPENPKLKHGIFGNFTSGASLGFFGKLEDDLKKEKVFKDDFFLRSLGSQYGGNIYGLIAGKVIIGAGGLGFSYDVGENGNGQSALKSHLITGNVGYAFLNKTHHIKKTMDSEGKYIELVERNQTHQKLFTFHSLTFAYLGYGTGKSTLKLSNYSDQELQHGDQIIKRSNYQEFTNDLSLLEFGIGTRLYKNPKGGIMFGMELGGYLNLGNGVWKNSEGKEVSNVSAAKLSGAYLRFTIGGGIFSLKDDAGAKISTSTDSSTNTTISPKSSSKKKKDKE
ncbi:MAG: hypothetical protein NZ108_02005 [Bacteroidia bacterium]|nr:hypothetical protein [Bacteroidia bacterium]